MSTTQRDHLQKLVEQLDSAVPCEGAKIRLEVYGGGPDESGVVANERGYLRFGIEFLKAGLCPPTGDGPFVECDLEALLREDSDIQFDHFVLRDEVDVPRHSPTMAKRALLLAGQAGCLVALLAIFGLVLVGLSTVFNWAF